MPAFPSSQRNRLECGTAAPNQESSLRPDPKVARFRGLQTNNPVVLQFRDVVAGEKNKALAIKTHQPVTGAEPQIAVLSPGNRLNHRIRQSIPTVPAAAHKSLRFPRLHSWQKLDHAEHHKDQA